MARRARGAGAVFQRADGRWEAQLRIGPSRRRSLYAQTRPDVVARLDRARWSMALGLPVRMPVTRTVADFLNDWLEVTRSRVRCSTFENYDFNVRRINSQLGAIPLCRLTPPTIQEAYGRLRLEGVGDAGIHQLHRTLHRALGQAFTWGLIPQNPTALVLPPRRPRRQMRALTAEELTRLLDSTQDDRLHALWVVLGTTGLRLGEALGLGWVDVQLDDRRLFVRRGLQRRRGGDYVFVEPKTVASRRMVMLSQLAVEALHRHQARQSTERESADRWCDWGLVFCSGEGGPMDGSRILKRLHRALAIAGLPTMRVHDLRHTAATILLTAGIHPKVVQEMLGHSTIGATLDIYSHVAPALHAEAAAHFDSVLAAASSTEMSGLAWP